MYQAIQMASGLFDLLPHVVITVEVENVGDEVERILIILDLGVKPSEIEAIGQILLIDVAEVLIPARRDKLLKRDESAGVRALTGEFSIQVAIVRKYRRFPAHSFNVTSLFALEDCHKIAA